MKKQIVSFIVIGTLLACLAGCRSNTPADTPTEPSTQANASIREVLVLSKEGKSISLPLTSGRMTAKDTALEFEWAAYEGELYLTESSREHYSPSHGNFSLSRIPGSDRYMCLTTEGPYTYLIDSQTGEVLDPLAGMDAEILNKLSDVSFSPNGQYVLISHHSGTVLELMDRSKDSKIKLPYEDGLYSISGHFIDNKTILITSTYQDADGQISYTLARYHISTGECTQLPGSYVSKDPNTDNFMALIEGPFAYTYTEGKLTIVDLRTMSQTVYPLTASDVTRVSYHTAESIYVVDCGVEYLLKTDGSMLTVSK